jgi:hypothetical protein
MAVVSFEHVNTRFAGFLRAEKASKTLESQDLDKRTSETGKVSCKTLRFDFFSLKEAKHARVKKIVQGEFST